MILQTIGPPHPPGPGGGYLCPHDPFHMTRGEYGLYYDTQLGAALPADPTPTDVLLEMDARSKKLYRVTLFTSAGFLALGLASVLIALRR